MPRTVDACMAMIRCLCAGGLRTCRARCGGLAVAGYTGGGLPGHDLLPSLGVACRRSYQGDAATALRCRDAHHPHRACTSNVNIHHGREANRKSQKSDVNALVQAWAEEGGDYLKRGTSVCGNALRVPINRVDDAVLRTLSGESCDRRSSWRSSTGSWTAWKSRTAKIDASNHRVTLRAVEREIANLAQAVAAGGQLVVLLCELRIREARRAELLTTIAAYEAATVVRFDRRSIQHDVTRHLDDWRGLLAKHTCDGRQLLREVLTGPLRFTPEGRTYRFEGEA
jgi:hypothetical protein